MTNTRKEFPGELNKEKKKILLLLKNARKLSILLCEEREKQPKNKECVSVVFITKLSDILLGNGELFSDLECLCAGELGFAVDFDR